MWDKYFKVWQDLADAMKQDFQLIVESCSQKDKMVEDEVVLDHLGFSDALIHLHLGRKLTRCAWCTDVGKPYLQEVPDMLHGNIIQHVSITGNVLTWTPTQEDLLADDWMVVRDDA